MFENNKDWAISNQASNRGRLNDYSVAGSTLSTLDNGSGSPLTRNGEGEDIVSSHMKI